MIPSRRKPRRYNAAAKAKQPFYQLKYRYGLSEQDYADLLRRQDGRCAICLRAPDENFSSVTRWGKQKIRLAVDHDHAASEMRVRGLLCRQCNLVLGNAGDSTEVLRRAIAYLERN